MPRLQHHKIEEPKECIYKNKLTASLLGNYESFTADYPLRPCCDQFYWNFMHFKHSHLMRIVCLNVSIMAEGSFSKLFVKLQHKGEIFLNKHIRLTPISVNSGSSDCLNVKRMQASRYIGGLTQGSGVLLRFRRCHKDRSAEVEPAKRKNCAEMILN